MRAFEPVGDRARWKTLYELLTKADVDDVVTYEDMAAALSINPVDDRRIIQQSIGRAATELLQVDKHAIEPVINEGYRIVKPAEHLVLAQRRGRRAERAMEKGHATVTNVDYNGLEADTRRTFELVGRAMAWQIAVMRRLDSRQRDFAESLASVQATVTQTAADQAAHESRLAWLEEQERKRRGGPSD